MNGLYSTERSMGAVKIFKTHHGLGNFLNKSVILLNAIIQILDLQYVNPANNPTQHQ
jgi:hypothetical protein